MDYMNIFEMKETYAAKGKTIPKVIKEKFDRAFDIEYIHNSNAIEGNTLTLRETKLIVEDGLSVGGKPLREIYEAVSHDKAFTYVKQCVSQGKTLTEMIVKDIHSLLMENIIVGGVYRYQPVRITGASHKPPSGEEMYSQIKEFFYTLERRELDAISLSAYIHLRMGMEEHQE